MFTIQYVVSIDVFSGELDPFVLPPQSEAIHSFISALIHFSSSFKGESQPLTITSLWLSVLFWIMNMHL